MYATAVASWHVPSGGSGFPGLGGATMAVIPNASGAPPSPASWNEATGPGLGGMGTDALSDVPGSELAGMTSDADGPVPGEAADATGAVPVKERGCSGVARAPTPK